MHVFLIFSKWDDPEHIELSRFPVRLVEVDPSDALTSPTVESGEALFKRPPVHHHVEDKDAVITGASNLETKVTTVKKTSAQTTSLIVFAVVAALTLLAAAVGLIVRWCSSVRDARLVKSKVRRRIRAQNELGAIVPHVAVKGHEGRVKLVFEDDDGVEVAVDLALHGMETALDLHEEVLQVYESAGVRTNYGDVLALHYKDAAGRLTAVTADTPLPDVAESGVLRLTCDSKAQRGRKAFARIAPARAEPDSSAGSCRRLMDDEDDEAADAFSAIMESREVAPGMITLRNSLSDQVPSTARPLLPTPRGSRARSGARRGGTRQATEEEDEEDDDDDADLIYRRHQRTGEPGRAGAARSMAL